MAKHRWRHGFACAAALSLLLCAAPACAVPGDAEAVAQARKDYAEAMKGHDRGLQNAMRAELAAQLEMSRKRAARKAAPDKTDRTRHARLGR